MIYACPAWIQICVFSLLTLVSHHVRKGASQFEVSTCNFQGPGANMGLTKELTFLRYQELHFAPSVSKTENKWTILMISISRNQHKNCYFGIVWKAWRSWQAGKCSSFSNLPWEASKFSTIVKPSREGALKNNNSASIMVRLLLPCHRTPFPNEGFERCNEDSLSLAAFDSSTDLKIISQLP